MAKHKYRQRESGLFVPGDSLALPNPEPPKPWYVQAAVWPMLWRGVGQVQFYGDPSKVVFVDGKVAFDPSCCAACDSCFCSNWSSGCCDNSEGRVNQYIKLTIAGVTGGDLCEQWNGDYILHCDLAQPTYCVWYLIVPWNGTNYTVLAQMSQFHYEGQDYVSFRGAIYNEARNQVYVEWWDWESLPGLLADYLCTWYNALVDYKIDYFIGQVNPTCTAGDFSSSSVYFTGNACP